MPRPILPLEQRFWARVQKGHPDECWRWTGRKLKGYGSIAAFKRPDGAWQYRSAHRLSYEFAWGPPPPDMVIGHKCNNRGCVNPRHLYLTTNIGNVRDAARDGLIGTHGNHIRGAGHPKATLTESAVRSIKAGMESGVPHAILAVRAGVSKTTISNIRNGICWRHIR